MSIARRGTPTFVVNDVADPDLVIPVPTGVLAGDKLYAIVATVAPSTSSVATPSGWQKLAELAVGSQMKSAVFQKTAAGSESGTSITWTFGGSGRTAGHIGAYSGVDTAAAPFGYGNGDLDVTSTAGLATQALALTAGDWLLVAAIGRQSPGDDTTKSWSTSVTADDELWDDYSRNTGDGADIAMAVWDSAVAMPSGSAQRTLKPNKLMAQGHVWAVRIPMAATGGGPTEPPPSGVSTWTNWGLPHR